LDFARIHFRITRKTYKGKVSTSEEATMNFPKSLHDFFRCISERRLEIRASREGRVTTIQLIEHDEPIL
jgi:hypothetical protein